MQTKFLSKAGFTLVELSIGMLIISMIIGGITILAVELSDKYTSQKLLLDHRQLINNMIEELRNVQTNTPIQISQMDMPDYLKNHILPGNSFQIRTRNNNDEIWIKKSPLPIIMSINLGLAGATVNNNGRNFIINYRTIPTSLCYQLYFQEMDLYCAAGENLTNTQNFVAVVDGSPITDCTNYQTKLAGKECTNISFSYAIPIN